MGEKQIRKFRQLKIMVLWYQNEQKFGRYCYYGCYCLPEGSHDIASGGYGKPLDEIDQACADFKQSTNVLLMNTDPLGNAREKRSATDLTSSFIPTDLKTSIAQIKKIPVGTMFANV